MPAATRMPFGSAKLSLLAPALTIIFMADQQPVMCMGNSKWGAVCLSLRRIDDADWVLFDFGKDVSWVHITDPRQWTLIPFAASSPLELQLHAPGKFRNKMLFRQTAPQLPLLKYVFSQKVTLSYADLHMLADTLNVHAGGRIARGDLLRALCLKICELYGCDDVEAFIQNCLALDSKAGKVMKVGGFHAIHVFSNAFNVKRQTSNAKTSNVQRNTVKLS